MPDTNARRRADVLRADARDILRLIERGSCLTCDRHPAPGAVRCPRCRGWRAAR